MSKDLTSIPRSEVTNSNKIFGSAIIEADPCLRHSLSVKVFNKNKATKAKIYNEDINKNLYSGILTQTLRGVCLKNNNTLSVPAPPEAINSCIKTRRGQQLESETKKSENAIIRLEILDINSMWKNDSETICIQVNMTGIKDCQNDDIDAEIVNIERRNLTECQKGFEKEVEQEI